MASLRSQLIYLLQWIQPCPFNPEDPVERQREAFEKVFRRFPMPEGVAVERLVVGERPAEWLRPENAESQGAILYLHGGGYCGGSMNAYRPLASRLALAAHAPILLLEYRLAPECPFPAGLQDALAAAYWLSQDVVSPDQLVIAGDSAGGGLTLATALSLRDEGHALPAALVCLSPWVDLTGSGESMRTRQRADPLFDADLLRPYARAYAGEDGDLSSGLVSPLFADLAGMPPMLVHVGDREILLSDSLRLADRAREADVEVRLEVWKGMWHVWHTGAGWFREAQEALDRVGDFVREHLGKGRAEPRAADQLSEQLQVAVEAGAR
jgi:epsilon-lactone hydrolase